MATPTLLLLLLTLDVAALFELRVPVRPQRAARSHVAMNAGGDSWDDNFMGELRSRITNSGSSAHLGPPDEVLRGLNKVFVLIFNPGKHDEGVYTLQGRMSPSAAYVLAFEETDEAERFAQLLQAEGFEGAQPMAWPADQVRTFCNTGRFELGIVPTGTLLTPPTHNEYDEEAYGKLGGSEDVYQKKRAPPPPMPPPMDRPYSGDGLQSEEDGYAELNHRLAHQRNKLERLFNLGDDDGPNPDGPNDTDPRGPPFGPGPMGPGRPPMGPMGI